MLRHALVAALVAVASACTAATAGAATPTAQALASDQLAMQTAYRTALDHWKGNPCGGDVKIDWRAMDLEFNAIAAWSAIPGADPTTFVQCGVSFNDALPWDYATMCSVMIHEVGHLLGHKHDDTPGSVMSHVTTATAPACEAAPAGVATAASTRPAAATKPRTAKRRTKRARSARARSARARSAAKRRALQRSTSQRRTAR